MKKVSVVLFVLVLAACTSSNQNAPRAAAPSGGGMGSTVTLTEADRSLIEGAVRARAGQPAATFRTMIAQKDAGGAVMVCGYVNPGAGDTPFVGTLSDGAFVVTDLGGTTERTVAVQKACHGAGIYI